jgi:predicted double-glycine peptidase
MEWERVDQSGAKSLQPGMSRFFFTLPTIPFSAGGDKGSINMLPIMPLPFALSIGSFFRSIPDWFSSFLDDFFEEPSIVSPLPAGPGTPVIDSPPRTTPTTGFGDLLKESPVATPAAEPAIEQSNGGSRYDIPVKSQGDLYGNAACAPTSVSMVLDYYHAQNPNLQTASPSELISMLDKGDGTFGSGVGLHLMNDDLNQLGYNNITVKSDANLDDLSTALNDGPVIVTAGVKLIGGQARDIQQAGNSIHAMVVKDMNTESVILNDPWSGTEKIFSRDTFSKMWAKGEHGMYVIRP